LKDRIPWILLLLAHPLQAEIVPAPLFRDGAVLQRDKPVPVWGRTEAGGKVTVTFAGQTKTATADARGRWQVKLDPMPASAEGRSLKISGGGSPDLEVKDVRVGEVWLASGQSNMQWPIDHCRKEDQEMAASGPVPLLRIFQVPEGETYERKETLEGVIRLWENIPGEGNRHVDRGTMKPTWVPAKPETRDHAFAVPYFFGRRLAEELQVPIGIIEATWAGSRIETWWAEEGLAGIEELAEISKERRARLPGFPEYDKAYWRHLKNVGEWSVAATMAMDAGSPAPQMPRAPELLKLGHGEETGAYQAMIHPLVPCALRGFIWYQGENNSEGMRYASKQKALIQGWRQQFQAPQAPFLFVQVSPHVNHQPTLWWAQLETLKIPNTGMVVINDIGDTQDIHPRNKSEVGRRLALWALADTYGRKDIVKSGPLFAGYTVTNKGITVHFDYADGGLASRDGKPLNWFEIAGPDGVYHPAEVTISADGTSLLLTSAQVAKPDRARFAWSSVAEPNLMNRAGLPAAAFNTHWPKNLKPGEKP
jgi:sialate O-acetylesterase